MNNDMTTGVVYTETVVHAAPAEFVADAPYQLAIIALDGGGRVTARITGDRVKIGDKVELAETRGGIEFFRLAAPSGRGSVAEPRA